MRVHGNEDLCFNRVKDLFSDEALDCGYSCSVKIPGDTRRPDPSAMFRLAIGSYVEQYSNVVAIIKKKEGDLYQAAEFDHPYPCTKVMWSPDVRLGAADLLATTGDYLRLWSVGEDGAGNMSVHKEALLNNNKTSEYCAPLTSFDWCEADSIIATSSIDTTGRLTKSLLDSVVTICITARDP